MNEIRKENKKPAAGTDIQKGSKSRKKLSSAPPIKVRENPKQTILKHASDDMLAMAIRDMMKKK